MSTELFVERWADLVQRWRDTPTTERTAVLQEALDHGLRQEVGDVLDADELLGSAAARECEEALLRLSGLVDQAGYGANPDVVAAGWTRSGTSPGTAGVPPQPKPGLRRLVVLGRVPRPCAGDGQPVGPLRA